MSEEVRDGAGRAQRLKKLRELTGLSRAALERKHGFSAATLRSWEDNLAGGLTDSGARRVALIFQREHILFSIDWLLTGNGVEPKRASDVTQADKEIQTLLHANPQVGLKEELHYFKKIHPDCIVHQVMDDTMKPFYEIGDYVAGVRVYEKGILGVLGKDCLVETADSRVIFRRLMRSTIEGCFNLMHLNPDTKVERPMMYDVDVVCAAPIIWIRKTG